MEIVEVTKVELFEHIRKDYFIAKLSIRSIAKRHKIHRRMVRQAIADANPPPRQLSQTKQLVLTPAFKLIIDEWLLTDQKAHIIETGEKSVRLAQTLGRKAKIKI